MPGRITAEGTACNVSTGAFDLRLVSSGLERGVPVEVVGRRGRSRLAPVADGDLVRVTGTWDRRSMRVRTVERLDLPQRELARRSA